MEIRRYYCLVVFLFWPLFVNAQVKGAALLLSSAALPTAIQTNKQSVLIWDTPENRSVIYIGTNKASLKYVTTVSTNAYPYMSGKIYGIAALNTAGIEGPMAYYPSNRVAELWLKGYSSSFSQSTNLARLMTFTNTLPDNMRYWGIADVTIRWEPPK